MSDYRVSFFKIGYEKNSDEKGKPIKSGKDDYLGSVVVDDEGMTSGTITGKAFRQAPEKCLLADRVKIEKL